MKFGKKLHDQLENSIPEWRPNFLSYKQLKKRLKQLGAPVVLVDAAILDVNEFSAPLVPSCLSSDAKGSGDGEADRGRKRSNTSLHQESKKRRLPLGLDVGVDVSGSTEPDTAQTAATAGLRTEKDNNFLRLVKSELHKFNTFFFEKEEEFLIRLGVLEGRTREVKEKCVQTVCVLDCWNYQELIQVRKLVVTLHGEMVLLMHYSSLNYIGLVKILKKHDKLTGAKLRQSVLISVLHQPFFSTANLQQLVERCLACENVLQLICPYPTNEDTPLPLGILANEAAESGPIPRQVEAALRTIQDIRR